MLVHSANLGELCVGFIKIYQCSLTKNAVLSKEDYTVIYNRLNQKSKFSLIQNIGVQNRSTLEDNETLTILYAIHMLVNQRPFFHTSFSDSEKKIHLVEILLLSDRVFAELLGTNFNPQFSKVLKLV